MINLIEYTKLCLLQFLIYRIAEDEPELGSVFVPGSKKQNLNHLLNFMYTPRGERGPERRGPGPAAGPRRYMPHRAAHPHNHALYLQAW